MRFGAVFSLFVPGVMLVLLSHPVAAQTVVLTEIMQNPAAVADSAGEWFEICNQSWDLPVDIDIDGWTIRDNGADLHIIDNGGSLIIHPGEVLVLGINADLATNGGAPVDYQYSNFILDNGYDEIVLLDGSGVEIDRIEYDDGTTFPDPDGGSMEFIWLDDDNTFGSSWHAFTDATFGDGDYGTPGLRRNPMVDDLPILINEVDADNAGTDTREFIELFDGGFGNTPLDGLVVVLFDGSDDASYSPVFDLGGFVTDANGFFVIGGAGVPNVDLVWPANDWLQNGADAVALYLGDASDFPTDTPVTTLNLIDAIVYDTDDADDPGLLVLLLPSQPQVNENGAGAGTAHSNQRFPDGGVLRETTSYLQVPPTPGMTDVPVELQAFSVQ
ncbi:MAG: hypothetical protein DRJ61_05120 [Acidobacteria bacterium]|nr:MAG: hypothetical protein DRJ61_05120 [Acidobacteriota bacterium]